MDDNTKIVAQAPRYLAGAFLAATIIFLIFSFYLVIDALVSHQSVQDIWYFPLFGALFVLYALNFSKKVELKGNTLTVGTRLSSHSVDLASLSEASIGVYKTTGLNLKDSQGRQVYFTIDAIPAKKWSILWPVIKQAIDRPNVQKNPLLIGYMEKY